MLPLIGIPADVKTFSQLPFHCVGEKYIDACTRYVGGIPVLIPARTDCEHTDPLVWMTSLDGVMLTGSHSHIDPALYQAEQAPENTQSLDRKRDAASFSIIAQAIDLGLPILGICRGFQEINVAFGGTIHQALHTRPGLLDHREPENASLRERYALAHSIIPVSGGIIDQLAGGKKQEVNSLHDQGIDRLGKRLRIEARADDGLIEAISVIDNSQWILGVQWHCEAQTESNPFYQAIFAEFTKAVLRKKEQRQTQGILHGSTSE